MPSLSSELESASVNASRLIIKTKVHFMGKTICYIFSDSTKTLNDLTEVVSGKHHLWIWQNTDFSSFLHMHKASACWTSKKATRMTGIFTLAENGTQHINSMQTKTGASLPWSCVLAATPVHGCVLSSFWFSYLCLIFTGLFREFYRALNN